ncbi:MAG: hypothetical protein FGM54_04450 [Chitinophagaceae bacterium]|nr:hypothetical protein [Chitinophagaceae bacterium]
MLSPIVFMVIVNESMRTKQAPSNFSIFGQTTINSNTPNPSTCTWTCYQNTAYCKTHHVKFLKPYYAQTDPLYFGLIGQLKSTGNYVYANMLVLVFLIPFIMYLLIIGILHQSKQAKSNPTWKA